MLSHMDNITQTATIQIKTGFSEMFKGGVIMDVVSPDQARIAEAAGATAVMARSKSVV